MRRSTRPFEHLTTAELEEVATIAQAFLTAFELRYGSSIGVEQLYEDYEESQAELGRRGVWLGELVSVLKGD